MEIFSTFYPNKFLMEMFFTRYPSWKYYFPTIYPNNLVMEIFFIRYPSWKYFHTLPYQLFDGDITQLNGTARPAQLNKTRPSHTSWDVPNV